ncbi:MAG: AAA family ATPase [Candidatus Competibacteraceae bacterium]
MTKQSSDKLDAIVARVTSIHIENFRGFCDSHELDTDADLVLITGANGFGKTSLMDALLLLLTGWHEYDYPDIKLISSQRKIITKSPNRTKKLNYVIILNYGLNVIWKTA